MNLTPPTITSAIQKMEQLGYIRRKPDEKDQRILRLGITDKGKACIDDICRVGSAMEELVFRGMSMEETLLLKRLLVQIRDNLMEGQDPSVLLPPM
jgi:DNA-binding MarR family transcriptional regulator